MMCPRATDMIGEIATAIANGLSAEEMSFAMRAQPTYNEGIGAAIEDAKMCIRDSLACGQKNIHMASTED